MSLEGEKVTPLTNRMPLLHLPSRTSAMTHCSPSDDHCETNNTITGPPRQRQITSTSRQHLARTIKDTEHYSTTREQQARDRRRRPGSSQSMDTLAMANRHLLFELSRQSRFALAQAKLVTVSTVVLISLFAFVISANIVSSSATWQTQTQSHRSPHLDSSLAAARQALELRLLQAEAADSQQSRQQQTFDGSDNLEQRLANPNEASNRDELISQLILARKLLDERLASKSTSPTRDQLIGLVELDNGGNVVMDNSYDQSANHYYDVVDPNASEADDDEQARSQLADLLLRQQEESSANDNLQNNDNDDEFNTKLSSFSSPYSKLPSASPLSSDKGAELAAAVAEGSNNNDGGQQFMAAEAAEKRQSNDANDGEQQQKPAKFTTLLEDEPKATTTTSSPTEVGTATPVSYGKIVKSIDDTAADKSNRTNASSEHQQHQWATSVFSRLFEKVASYMPFLSQEQPNIHHESATRTITNMTNSKREDDKEAEQQGAKVRVDLNIRQHSKDVNDGTNAKHRVSTPMVSSKSADAAANDKTKQQSSDVVGQPQEASGGKNDKSETNDNDSSTNSKLVKVRISQQVDPANEDTSFASLGTFSKEDKPSNDNRLFVNTNMKRVVLDNGGNELDTNHAGGQSNIVLSPVYHPSTPALLDGKYIYAPAPQQHYYIHTDGSKPASIDYNSQLFQMAAANGRTAATTANLFASSPVAHPNGAEHRPAMLVKHHQVFHPNEHIFATYEPMKSAYAYQKGGLDGILLSGGSNNSRTSSATTPNDLYFLVMVGAFCVMAMAVVLAAGLFAYRVQQNRKSSQDTDYPTYGVVGPNNMNGKCGAAAFVGGYLGNNIVAAGGPGSSGSFGSNKSGCSANTMKHLPDLYASDSGLASTDKGSSKKASLASASSDNNNHQGQQQQQAASHRGTPNNFMMANQDAARMYHYQHQKQQMIISDRSSAGRHTSASDLDSDDENEDGSYTVYECPGLASAHEMEIKNPLFNDDQTP